MVARMKVKISVALIGSVFGMCLRLQALDRWSALSQIESGDDDCAVGSAGEVSRYQIKPEVWRRHAPAKADWANPDDALFVARETMQERCAVFERAFHRPPTVEFTSCGMLRRRFNNRAKRCPAGPNDSAT